VKIKKIFGGVNVQPMLWALQANPWLWNADKERTIDSESPHREVDDIWARYMAKPIGPGPHESMWYPAADLLPVRDLAFALMADVRGERLGGILITRIKAGMQCYPHDDRGGWHAEYYRKFAVQIQSAPGQEFCFDGESLEPMPGDVYEFDNQHTHWVKNPTAHDRITMIVCIKSDTFLKGVA
jgi:hypothetical protein